MRTCSENSIEIVQDNMKIQLWKSLKKKGKENIQTNDKADSLLITKEKVEIGSVF